MADDVIIIYVHMTDFSREARLALVQFAVDDDTDSDAPAYIDEDYVLEALANALEALTVSHASGIVANTERQFKLF